MSPDGEGAAKSWGQLLERRHRQPVVIGLGLCVLAAFSGSNTVIYYASSVLRDAGVDDPGVLDARRGAESSRRTRRARRHGHVGTKAAPLGIVRGYGGVARVARALERSRPARLWRRFARCPRPRRRAVCRASRATHPRRHLQRLALAGTRRRGETTRSRCEPWRSSPYPRTHALLLPRRGTGALVAV